MQANGQLRDMVARGLMLQLHRAGLIVLPAKRKSVPNNAARTPLMGLVTTHDLALTQIVEEAKPYGANFHFEDQFRDGRMSFDYRLRPGIVEKSNALELMRSIGLDV